MIDQILVNTSDKIEIDTYYNGVLTNPSSITIKRIQDPSGTVILTDQTPTTGDTTGRYEFTLDAAYTTVTGVYSADWEFVFDDTTYKHTQYFEVVSTLRTGYVTPYDVRDLALYDRITATEPTDDVLQKYIDRATQIIDSYLGGSLNYSTYVEKRRCVLDKINQGIHVQLSHRPIVSITSISLMTTPLSTSTVNTDYIRINEEAGYFETFGTSVVDTINACINYDLTASPVIPVATVTYTAGYTTVPEPVKQAAVMLVEYLYKQGFDEDRELARFTIDNVSEFYEISGRESSAIAELGGKGVQAILKLLRPYKQRAVAGFAGPLG